MTSLGSNLLLRPVELSPVDPHAMRTVRAKRARAAGMSPAALALRSDVVRRAASRGGTLRCAETHALPTVLSISPTRLIDYVDVAGREATSRQRCCRSRHLFRTCRKSPRLLERDVTKL